MSSQPRPATASATPSGPGRGRGRPSPAAARGGPWPGSRRRGRRCRPGRAAPGRRWRQRAPTPARSPGRARGPPRSPAPSVLRGRIGKAVHACRLFSPGAVPEGLALGFVDDGERRRRCTSPEADSGRSPCGMSSPTPPRSADAGRLPDRDYDPERLSMVGYNDIEMVPKTIPSLTMISPARRRDGRVTTELFLMIDRNLNCVVAASMASAMAS
jgi:hypothetical protein